jgi:hypothetical protein
VQYRQREPFAAIVAVSTRQRRRQLGATRCRVADQVSGGKTHRSTTAPRLERNKAHRADNPPVRPIHLIAAGLKMHCPGGALSQTGSEAQSPGHVAMPMPRGGAGPPRGRSGTPNRAVCRRGIIAICATYGHARPVEAGRNRTPVGLIFAAEVYSETADKKTARRRSLGRF